MPAASRRTTSSRDGAHRIDDAVERCGHRAFLAFGVATAGDARPSSAPHIVSANESDALATYVLNLSEAVDNNFVADSIGVPRAAAPKWGDFVRRDLRPDIHLKACMADCADFKRIEIKSTAAGKNVTPRTTGPRDDMRTGWCERGDVNLTTQTG